ncbi:hypothetical protein [Saccharothrix coeruleofusca]|uniref:Uncharacterized protein n=1 Tax=Saccharothrix coeruleofusca TaxID=33919 RepID=A0A918AS33_9PSEU|nr:hypothetical protein [Saccharothrix coeruleofusca]MBP2335706.1 hypothetical protein [Saccharothrix coeruleofusca]GGP75640.1 hypothetical protein GCM10010185_56750 [Saccharothrix coeruleofusca]
MTSTTTRSARPLGDLFAVSANVVLLVLVNLSPGWRAVPFLTERAGAVVVVFDIALAVGLVAAIACLVRPHRLVRLACDVVTTAFAMTVLWTTWSVFPFAFDDPAVDWASVLAVGLPSIGAVVLIAFLVQTAALVRVLWARTGPGDQEGDPSAVRPEYR